MAATTSQRKRVRFTLDVTFNNVSEKEAFTERLSAIRSLLTPCGQSTINNRELLHALFDCTDSHRQQLEEVSPVDPSVPATSSSFLRHLQ